MNSCNLPKNIKRKRTKKFTKKRQPYKTYLQANWVWTDIFLELDQLKKVSDTFLKDTSLKYGIVYSTLSNKYNKHRTSKITDKTVNNENRGGSNKIFTQSNEKKLYDLIVNDYINKEMPLNDSIIKEIALKMINNDQFKASNGWCNMFKKNWNLSSQTVKPVRVATNVPSNKDVTNFLDEYDLNIKGVKKNIFNYDETSTLILNPPKKAIRIKGSKSAKVKIKGNIKGAVSTGLTISAIGAKLKPIIIGKGTTNRCLNKFDLKSDTIGAFSKSGWITESIMIIVLDQIHKKTGGSKSVLLLDQYKVHQTEKVKEYASSKNITLVYVPVGMTNKYQPLDITINGMLKAKMRKSHSTFMENNKDGTYTHAKCISDLMINLKSISKKTIIDSFNCLKRS